MKKRVIGIIVSVELLLVIIIPLITFNWVQGTKSIAENRTLVSFPSLFNSEGKIREDLLVALDDWFKDNIGLRDLLINLSSVISFNIMHSSTSEKVEIGKDGWLFYSAENNLSIVDGTYPDFDEEKLALYCEQLVEVRNRLAEQGREFVLILPPSKVSIYPEYIQSGDYHIMETPADIIVDYIEGHSDLRVVRLKDALLEEKKKNGEQLYYKTDTHWNFRGRYVGYRKIIEDFNDWGLIDTSPLEARFYEKGAYSGDLARMLGAVNLDGDKCSEDSYNAVELVGSFVQSVSNEKSEEFEALMTAEGIIDGGSMWTNPAESDEPSLLVYGDSMIGSCNIDYIAANFSKTSFVWSYVLRQEMIDFVDPDIVALDISERGLSSCLPGLFDSYLNIKIVKDKEKGILDIYYEDNGKLESCYMPTWSEANDQSDLVWYEAEREGENCWHVRVDLNDHESGRYITHIYDGPNGSGKYITATSFDVGKITMSN